MVLLVLCLAATAAVAREQVNYEGFQFVGEDFQGHDFQGANFRWARFWGPNNLKEANLQGADLQGAILRGTNLRRANLRNVNLQGANLEDVDLEEANLQGADLRGAILRNVNLKGVKLVLANLAEAFYEPNPGSLPDMHSLMQETLDTRAEGVQLWRPALEKLRFGISPAGLIELREAFKKAGMRTQERQLTYAIERSKRRQAWNPVWHNTALTAARVDPRPWLERLAGKSESLFSYIAFELPSGYGMAPARALLTIGVLILVFSSIYMVALFTARGRAGIWATWPTDRAYQEEGTKETVRVTYTFFFPQLQLRATGRWWGVLVRALCIPLIGLYFSILSAFSIGWRELNIGTWIARVQPREYILRATGWVRTVSGIQSLLSVYLLALWVLTYFGRPFE